MSGISPQRKNRRKRKKKTRNDNSKQIPAHVCLIQNGKTLHCNDSEMIANTPINNEIDPLAADKAIAEEQLNILADSESDEQKCPLVRQLNAENASKYESDLMISTLCKSSTPSLSSSVTTCRNSGRKSRNSLHRTDSKDPEYIRNKTNGNNFSKKVHPSQSLPDLMSTNSDYDSTSMRSIGVHRTGGKRLNKVSRANSFTMPSESQNSTSLCNTAHDRQYSDETQFIEMRDFLRKVNIEYRSEQQADSFHGDSHSLISKSFNNDVASFAELGLTSINSKDTIKTGAAERMFNNNSDYDSTDLNNESLQTYRGIDGAHKAYDENNVLTPYTDQSSDLANFQPMYTSSVKSNSTTRNSRNKQLRSGSTEAVEDKRDVDELVNFINGTDNNVKTHKKKKEKKTNKFEFK